MTPVADIAAAGPLTHVWVGNELSCQVQHIADAPDYEFYGPDIFPADAGTFIAMDGVLYAPDFTNHDYTSAGFLLGAYTPFTPVSQTPVTGSGATADPFKVVTVVDVAATGLHIQQTDTYVDGQEHYTTEVMISNDGAGTASGVLYRAGDAFLGGSDTGYGFTEGFSGNRNAVACSVNANNVPPGKIEEFIPLTGGNNYFQNEYDTVWGAIGSQAPFPDTCACTDNLDNGAGISWNFSIPAGGSATYSHVTTFSPLGLEGLVTSKTADSPTSHAGTQNGYTITIENPNANVVTVSSITDTLPAGFAYVPGSTTDATTNDPAIVAQMLTWSGSFSVPARDSISLHFAVIVADTPGDYFNEAGGSAEESYNVIGTGPTAQITVTEASTPTPTATGTPTATLTPTPTATATFTPIATATATATFTPTPTATATFTPTPTPEESPTPTPLPPRRLQQQRLLQLLPRQPPSRRPQPRRKVQPLLRQLLYAYRYRYGDCNSYLYSNSYRDSHLHADPNPGGKSNPNSYRHRDSNSNVYSNSYRDSHLHADPNTGGKSNPNCYRHRDSNSNVYSNPYRDSHVHADAHRDSYCDSYLYSNANRDGNLHTDANSYGNGDRNRCLYSNSYRNRNLPTDANSYGNIYAYTYSNVYSNTNGYLYPNAHTHTNSLCRTYHKSDRRNYRARHY